MDPPHTPLFNDNTPAFTSVTQRLHTPPLPHRTPKKSPRKNAKCRRVPPTVHRSQLAWEEGRVLAEVMQHCRGNGAYPVGGRSCRRCLRPVFYRNKCLFKLLLNLERAEYSERR